MNDLEKLKESYDSIGVTDELPIASIEQVCEALAAAQGEFKAPQRTKTAKVKGQSRNGSEYAYEYKYAPLEEIINSVKETLAKNDLFYYQYLLPPRFNVMRTVIRHASGEFIASDYPVFPTKEGAAGFASGVTYARRYGLSLALGLAPEDDDDNTETSAVGSPRMAEQPVPSSRSHSSPLDGGEREGTGDLIHWSTQLQTAAEQGMEALRRAWADMPASHKKNLMPELTNKLKPRAAEVDAKDRS